MSVALCTKNVHNATLMTIPEAGGGLTGGAHAFIRNH